jgi:hypothetical protein
LVLYPSRSLVQNVGVDGSGTHGAGTASLQSDLRVEPDLARGYERWPSGVELDTVALDRVKHVLSGSRSRPLIRLIRRLFT